MDRCTREVQTDSSDLREDENAVIVVGTKLVDDLSAFGKGHTALDEEVFDSVKCKYLFEVKEKIKSGEWLESYIG